MTYGELAQTCLGFIPYAGKQNNCKIAFVSFSWIIVIFGALLFFFLYHVSVIKNIN